ncbi:MAG: transglycosylase domain-containing protein [Arachnia sp.]
MATSARRGSKAAKKAKAAPQGSRAKRFWKRFGVTALVVFIVVGLSGMGGFFFLYATTDLPDPNADFQTNTTFIYYNDGEERLGSLAVQNRQTISYDEMPQLIKDAVVAAENRTFWTDPGFSIGGIARGAFSIATGGELQGGSTITQQYIKILYLDSGQRLSRKVKELMLAIKMGRELPKEQILEGYLNTIYFGRGAYGIQAAARSFFLKDAKDLTLEESAALAAILNNPAAFNPSGGDAKREKLFGRYQYVLSGMLDMGAITQAEYDRAKVALPEFPEVPVNNRYGGWRGFLIKQVEDELEEKGFSEAEVQGGGLKVITTLDASMQAAAAKTAKEYPKKAAEAAAGDPDPKDLHVAIASVDTSNGGILALYGGPDYVKDSRNWARTARPAASTFKAFATIAGLRNGFSLDSIFNGDTFTPRGDTKTIRNEFSHQYGPVTLRKATADSINTAFVDMTQQIDNGAAEVAKAANDAGAPTHERGWELNNRIALGMAEVSPLNMANAYATLANSGQRNETHIVDRVLDREGNVIYQAAAKDEQTIDKNVAANVTDALTSVVTEGTGTRASALGRPVAGKTGTNDFDGAITSAWFVGYTKQVSTAVMYVAGDSGNENLETYKRPQDGTFFGSTYPLMTWVDYMSAATKGMPVEEFDRPKEIEPERGRTAEPAPTRTRTAEPSPTPTPTPTPTDTPTPTQTPTETPTSTPTGTPSAPTTEPTDTAEPTTPTETPTTPQQSATVQPPKKPAPTTDPEEPAAPDAAPDADS